jgi:glycerophosphoryl diester phosphodiesterase
LILTNSRRLLLGHRGARRSAPENTLTAFDLALAHGCDGFELDVRYTADQRAILCHDAVLAGLPVAEAAYSAILQKYRAITPANDRTDCEAIPCLEDVIARYAGRAYLDIELKVAGMEEKVVVLVASLAPNTYVVSSFLPEVLQAIHGLQPSIPLGLISDQQATLAQWREIPCAVVVSERKLVTQSLVDAVHNAEKKIFVWTVNQQEEMLRLAKAGVDGIISDDTELLGHTFPQLRRGGVDERLSGR